MNMIKQHKILRRILLLLLCVAMAILVFLFSIVLQAPRVREINATPQGYRTTITDEDGNPIRTIYGQEANRVYVTLDTIPQDVQNAFIAIEDARFYQHHGIDPRGILRAFANGLKHRQFHQGASTITQQLLKNNVFTDWTEECTFRQRMSRKLQEMYLALCLEQKQSKTWILENYLNTINLGGGTYGVQSASKYYFNKDVSDLSLSEATVLAGITKNPSGYNPLTHPDDSMIRQNAVCSAMLNQGYITQAEYDNALADNVFQRIASEHAENSQQLYSYFEDALLYQVRDDLMAQYGYDEETAWDLIYRGGLTIASTVDPEIQSICEKYASREDISSDGRQVSIVILDNETGAVKAIVGGSGTKDSNLAYNRATDALRQPGSTLKILGEYAAAMDLNQLTLGTVLDDCPTTYSDGTSLKNGYNSYKGRITIRQAIAKSTNTVALKVFQDVGVDQVMHCLNRFGITTLDEQDQNESLALGGTYHGVSNLELTAAYHALSNQGVYVKPYYYTTVTDQNGAVILEHQMESWHAVQASTAALLTEAMGDVLANGTGTDAYFSNMPLAGKSGTTTENRDLWFLGYSPYYTCGVWGGYDDNSPQKDANYVKKLWKNIMQETHANYLNKEFPHSEELETALICTKCGNLAVDGLCSNTVQGNMTRKEYFLKGTIPFTYCNCHEAISICQSSHMAAGSYCSDVTDKVYLTRATEGTADTDYLMPETLETCTEHTGFWNMEHPWDDFWGNWFW